MSRIRIALVMTAVLCVARVVPGVAGELVVNGGFETGSFGPAWVHGSFLNGDNNPNLADHVVLPDLPYSGSYSALLGFKYTTQTTHARGYMYQTVSIPNNISRATLYFKVRQQGYDSTPYDPFVSQVRATNNAVLQTILAQTFPEYNYQFKDSGWLSDNNAPPVGFNMLGYAGQTVRLYFEQANTIDSLYETWAYIDDVSLIYTKWVDLFAGSNGNDVFGALGIGAGGLATQGGVAGDTLFYTIDVENEGTVADTYLLSLATPAGWTSWIEVAGLPTALPYTTPSLAPGTIASYQIAVIPAAATAAGSYNLILDAVSTAQGTRFDSATLRANVANATYGTDLVVDGNGFGTIGDNGTGGFALRAAPWDSTVTYSLVVRNTGDAATTYAVDMFPDAGVSATIWLSGTPHTTAFTTPSIPSGGSLTMTLDVFVSSPTLGGDYETIVVGTAVADTLKKDSIKAVLRLRAPRVDMIIGSNGNDIYDGTSSGLGGSSSTAGERSTPVTFPVVIQNESSLADSFQLSWAGPGGAWNAVLIDGGVNRTLPFTTPVIAPFSQVSYVLQVTIPGNAAFGTYPTILNAVSLVDNGVSESVTAAVSVTDASQGVDMVIDGSGAGVFGPIGTGLGGTSAQSVLPGDSVIFTVDMQNLAGLNSIDVMWNAPVGWQVTFDGLPSPIAGHPAGVYQLKVVVPVSSPGGTFDIIVDAQKSDKPFYMDSVIGRVQVIPPVVVDALIDGNGNGIYGGLGSGLGGLSSQTTSAPATLNFTVELENESAVSDQYTVSWNSIPSWIATMNASPSPVTTGNVGPGSTDILFFQVSVPPTAPTGSYSYIIDVVSATDSTVVESVEARVTILGPPRADLVIDGNGLGVFGLIGSGDGGTSLKAAAPGALFTSNLEVHNVGSFPDSFYVTWSPPPGWPAGSVVISDGSTDFTAPFWTPLIGAGGMRSFTVEVQVPAGAGAGQHPTIINTTSQLPPNAPESVRLVAQTDAVVLGRVFEDRDQNGVFSTGDTGIPGVSIVESATAQNALSDGAGGFVFHVASGTSALVIEQNLSGFVSLSPDTVGPTLLAAGDTLFVEFADVAPMWLSTGVVLNGVPGGFVDFPHLLAALTRGQVSLVPTTIPGIVTSILLDENANGIFDGSDRQIQAADLYLDPALGDSTVSVLVRVFIPATLAVGTTFQIDLDATQMVEGTAVTLAATATDGVLVVANPVGRVTLQKQVDLGAAAPGEVLTYSISFFNAGSDSVQNIVLMDPVSPYVDPLSDAFGPGMDVEWQLPGAGPQYLTLTPADGDECEYTPGDRVLRLLFSKNTPFYLRPGDQGTLTYKVVVK